jgi:hypothetical protein
MVLRRVRQKLLARLRRNALNAVITKANGAIMNWKLPNQLRWVAQLLRDDGSAELAEIAEEAAKEIELSRAIITGDPLETPIEEGDRANG